MKISQSVEIERPAEVVFPWLADPCRAKKWMTSVTKTKIIENKPDRVGTRFCETIEEEGSTTEMVGVIAEFEKNRRITFHLEGKFNSVEFGAHACCVHLWHLTQFAMREFPRLFLSRLSKKLKLPFWSISYIKFQIGV